MKRVPVCVFVCFCSSVFADDVRVRGVEGQPLAANVARLVKTLDVLGSPLPSDVLEELRQPHKEQDARKIQELLDSQVLAVVHLNPEYRVKVTRGPAKPGLSQHGYHPYLIKVLNESTLTERLRVSSPQSGAVYAGVASNSMKRQQQENLISNQNLKGSRDRIFEVEMFDQPPMTDRLSGLEVEYAVLLVYCSEAGKREATISFDVGQGTQDIGFRGELPILFDVEPAVPVKLSILDYDGTPTTAKLVIKDRQGHVYPPQPKRVAPDFFFQEQIYRHHGESIDLAPGEYTVTASRGPEYLLQERQITVPAK